MAHIEPELKISIWGTANQLRFSSTQDVAKWAESEIELWRSIPSPSNNRISRLHKQQIDSLNAIQAAAAAEDIDTLRRSVAGIQSGTIVVSGSAGFAPLRVLGANDGDVAGIMLLWARSDGPAHLGALGIHSPYDLILKTAAIASVVASQTLGDGVKREIEESSGLIADLRDALADERKNTAAISKELDELRARYERDEQDRSSQWESQVEEAKSEWASLKKVYDTELGLRAPTTYWTSRAVSHRNQAIGYGIAFALLSGLFVALFLANGIPFLKGSNGTASLVSVLLPVLVPSFAAVWVLRILGRLLSESLQLMRDAKERETLVKTFLALMKDDSTGKAVVKDEDRILILHALFRPSSLVASDDSPPVHWFDVLANKIGQKK